MKSKKRKKAVIAIVLLLIAVLTLGYGYKKQKDEERYQADLAGYYEELENQQEYNDDFVNGAEDELAGLEETDRLMEDPANASGGVDSATVNSDLSEENVSAAVCSYNGKTFSVVGDSYSYASTFYDWQYPQYRWWYTMAEMTGMTLDTNTSMNGQTATRLPSEAYSLGYPDVIFVMLGLNDIALEYPEEKIINNYTAMIGLLKNAYPSAEVILVTYPYQCSKPGYYGAQEAANPLIRQIAESTGTRLIDTDTYTSENLVDGTHTTPEGSRILGETVAEALIYNK